MARLSKEDWIEEGFKVLQGFAQDKLRILYLCKRLQVTRGSFYHHFESIEDYITELMKVCEASHTKRLIELSNKGTEGVDKMKILSKLVFESDHRVEAALRSWSFTDPNVAEYLAKVDRLRIKHLESIFGEMGYKGDKVKNLAKLDYATLVGLQLLYPKITKRKMAGLYKDYWLNQEN